jgi:hypothetical protein
MNFTPPPPLWQTKRADKWRSGADKILQPRSINCQGVLQLFPLPSMGRGTEGEGWEGSDGAADSYKFFLGISSKIECQCRKNFVSHPANPWLDGIRRELMMRGAFGILKQPELEIQL